MTLPAIKLNQGIHVMHLYYHVERFRWSQLAPEESRRSCEQLAQLCAAFAAASHPRLLTYANVGARADLAFLLFAAKLGTLAQLHRDLEACFPPGTLSPVLNYLSVTELTEYMPTEADVRHRLIESEKLVPDTPEFVKRFTEERKRQQDYAHYRLYPELPDWEVMGFYPMSKRRAESTNWYLLDFDTRKRLMAGHARTGRKFSGRVSQLITGSSGLDNWEWGVTLMAHQVDALKEIVYEMRFDEVSARYGEFGPFFVAMRLNPSALWEHLRL